MVLQKLDVAATFLQGDLDDVDVYTTQVKGYEEGPPGSVWRLQKALKNYYGISCF